MKTLRAVAFFALLCFAAPLLAESPVTAQHAFPKLQFTMPIHFGHVPDGSDRVLVVEQKGRVLIFENRDDVATFDVAIDIRPKVKSGGEEGLLGLAFHPKFKENGQVFLHYTAQPGRMTTVSRFKMDDERKKILPASEEVIFTLKQPFPNHNGGWIDFSPKTDEGLLYISLGDGGAAADPLNAGQDKKSLLGKILRIDVDRKQDGAAYAIPKDNPFAGEANARGEIWAWGLRNAWRCSFDRETGDLWAGDVGQGKWEEIDVIVKGGNYGWRLREGRHDFNPVKAMPNDLIEPVAEHPHGQADSITGGYVYRGTKVPALAGAYIYGDFARGLVWMLPNAADVAKANKAVEPVYLAHVNQIASFGQDKDGEVYVVDYGGLIWRFVGK